VANKLPGNSKYFSFDVRSAALVKPPTEYIVPQEGGIWVILNLGSKKVKIMAAKIMNQSSQASRRQFLVSAGASLLAALPPSRVFAEKPVRVPTVDEHIRKLAEEASLSMQFRGKTAAECRTWQAAFAAKLRNLLGPHRPPAQWKVEVERTVKLMDHRREELVLTANGISPLPVYLLLPLPKLDKPRPGVLALHGHGRFGYDTVAGRDDRPEVAEDIKRLHYDYGRQLVRRGYVVAVPCLTPFGRRLGDRNAYGSQDPCGVTFVRLQLLGKVLMAENLRDCLWALEFLSRRPEVDAKRLGCVGLSYGGRMTMLTAALEPRLRVAVISGALNVMQERVATPYSCGAQVIPGLLRYGDVPEIGALIAPRPCVWEVGARDESMIPKWTGRALERMARVYRALGAKDHLHVDRFDGGHEWSGRVAYPLLKKVLG
jgi:dienelactone hydrolase